MVRTSTFAAMAALGLSVAGCASTSQPDLSAANNPSLYSVHQPVVQRTDFVIDLAASGEGLSDAEAARFDAWLASIGTGYGDRISVDEPRGYENADARADVARVAGRYGLLLSDGAPLLGGALQPGTIRVIASRATASVPGCPEWSENATFESTDNTSANFGCAINSNLAAMIANPEDLVLGQDGTVAGSGTTATRAIRTYRERPPSGRQGLPETSTTRGNQ